MAFVNDPLDVYGLKDWTSEIMDVDNKFGFITEQNYFNVTPTASLSILFDKVSDQNVLIPQSDRDSFSATYGKDFKVKTIALALPYFNHRNYITVRDIQDQRRHGAANSAETLATVKADKITKLRNQAEQTLEYLQFSAMTGITKDAEDNVIADMYAEFGLNIADYTVDLVTQTATTDLDAKIALVEEKVVAGLMNGSAIGGIDFFMSDELFDEFKAHPKFREVYIQYQNIGKQLLRDSMSSYYGGFRVRMFEHEGVRFIAYNPKFAHRNPTTGVVEVKQVLAAGTGFAVPRGAGDLFRGYTGPANKLDLANMGGERMFAFEYGSQDNRGLTLEVEFSPLFFCTKPTAIIHLT